MDVALAIFNIGAGLGVLAAGLALAYLAWRVTPLIRESRALTADLRRLTATTETELGPILTHARELTGNVEELSEDVAVKLDRIGDIMNALQRSLDTGQVTAAPRPSDPWPEAAAVEGPELWAADGPEAGPLEGSELWPVDGRAADTGAGSEPWPAEGSDAWSVEPSEPVPTPTSEAVAGTAQEPRPVERPDPWPVESWETREDPSGS